MAEIKEKKFFISLDDCIAATRNKEIMEVIVFSLMVKSTFRSSVLKNYKISELKEIFSMGSDKIRRILENGKKYRYIQVTKKGHLLFEQVKCEGNGNLFIKLISKTANDRNELKSYHKFKEIEIKLRKAIALNYIRLRNRLHNKLKKARNPESYKGFRRNEKIKRMYEGFSNDDPGISQASIAKALGLSRYTTYRLMKQLISEGLVDKKEQLIETDIYPGAPLSAINDFRREAHDPELSAIRDFYKKEKNKGYLVRKEIREKNSSLRVWRVMCMRTNIYSNPENTFKFLRKKPKKTYL